MLPSRTFVPSLSQSALSQSRFQQSVHFAIEYAFHMDFASPGQPGLHARMLLPAFCLRAGQRVDADVPGLPQGEAP